MSRSSEFGRGYATCLIQFVNHRARLRETEDLYRSMQVKHPDLFSNDGAEMWANGASDHLYELVRPRHGVTAANWRAAKALQDRALDIGHGLRPSSKSDPAECRALLDEADRLLAVIGVVGLDAAIEWDRAHGLAPLKGTWSCAKDLSRRGPA